MSGGDHNQADEAPWYGCTDSPPYSAWSCIEYDGTGLWCEACRARTVELTPAELLPEVSS